MPDSVRVSDFGAIGDGVANDSNAIQRAIDSLGDRGGVVLFPRDTLKKYLIDGESLKVRPGITLAGEGLPEDPKLSVRARVIAPLATLVRRPGGPKAIVEIVPHAGRPNDTRSTEFMRLGFKVMIGTIDPPKPDDSTLHGNFRTAISCDGVSHVSVRGCAVEFHADDGISFWGYTNHAILVQNCKHITIKYCEFVRCQVKCGGGAGGVDDVEIQGNRFVSPHNYGISTVARKDGAVVSNIQVLCNEMYDLNEGGVYIGDDATRCEHDLGRISIRNVCVRLNYFGGEWRSPLSGASGGEPKGVYLRFGSDNRNVQIDTNAFSSTVRAKGSFGILCSHHERPFQHAVAALHIEGNIIQRMDHHGIKVQGHVEGLGVHGNVLTDTRGVLLEATVDGGVSGAVGRNNFYAMYSSEHWLTLDATKNSLGPITVHSIPSSKIEQVHPDAIDLRLED